MHEPGISRESRPNPVCVCNCFSSYEIKDCGSLRARCSVAALRAASEMRLNSAQICTTIRSSFVGANMTAVTCNRNPKTLIRDLQRRRLGQVFLRMASYEWLFGLSFGTFWAAAGTCRRRWASQRSPTPPFRSGGFPPPTLTTRLPLVLPLDLDHSMIFWKC